MREIVLLYMPVIHRGYVDFLKRYAAPHRECVLVGASVLTLIGGRVAYVLKKDAAIRALPETIVRDFIRSQNLYASVDVMSPTTCHERVWIAMPDEDVLDSVVHYFFPKAVISRDPIRLRYDRKGVERVDPVPATECTSEDLHRSLMGKASLTAERSKDWWLSVGALIAKDGKPLLVAYNHAALDPDVPNILGDPRSIYSRGENAEHTLAFHAERGLVARAACVGLSLKGTDAYVTHFPCVACAASLAEAGVQRIFFKEGYSRLESAKLLQSKGVEIFRVV